MKADLKDVTFLLPCKLEGEDRKRNLKIVVDYLFHHFDTNIIVNEQDTREVPTLLKEHEKKFTYMPTERADGVIHRTKQLNDMCKAATTPVVVNCDIDVLLERDAYLVARDQIVSGNFDIVLPYNGKCFDVPKPYHPEIIKSNKVNFIPPSKCRLMYLDKSVGGMLFFDRKKYIEGGLENERFICWGYEDNERIERFVKKLGYRITKLSNNMYHLQHGSCKNSGPGTKFVAANQAEFSRIKSLTPEGLKNEIKNWPWIKTTK